MSAVLRRWVVVSVVTVACSALWCSDVANPSRTLARRRRRIGGCTTRVRASMGNFDAPILDRARIRGRYCDIDCSRARVQKKSRPKGGLDMLLVDLQTLRAAASGVTGAFWGR